MNYYIADTHFDHANIIRHCNRPFKTVEQMNETLIENCNAVVKKEDDLFFIGDFAYRSKDPLSFAARIKGRKHLILGNHDKDQGITKEPDFLSQFVEYRQYDTIMDNGRRVVLFHYPIVAWDGHLKGYYHLFGHVHNSIELPWFDAMEGIVNCFNVCAEVTGYRPVTLDELIAHQERVLALKNELIAQQERVINSKNCARDYAEALRNLKLSRCMLEYPRVLPSDNTI